MGQTPKIQFVDHLNGCLITLLLGGKTLRGIEKRNSYLKDIIDCVMPQGILDFFHLYLSRHSTHILKMAALHVYVGGVVGS